MSDASVPPKLERALLFLVRAGGGQASWHRLATRLPSYDAPLDFDMMVALKDMLARGLVTREMAGGGMDRWGITPVGEKRLALLDQVIGTPVSRAELEAPPKEPAPPKLAPAPGPLSPAELQAFAVQIGKGARATVAAIMPYVDDGLRFYAILRQLLAANPADAQRVAEVALYLGQRERGVFARDLIADPDPRVRAALFRAWTPVRTDVPGDPLPTVPDAELDELLRRGLTDESTAVREAAAVLAFLAVRGASLVGELIAALGSPAEGVRWWALLALGGAHDALSLELISQFAGEPDVALASAAVRALAQRPDGHARWFAALADSRADVVSSALFALATVVTGLNDATVTQLAADPRPDVRDALAAYRVRTAPTN